MAMTDMGMGGLSSMGGMQTPQIQTGNTTPAVQSQPTVTPNTANAMGGTVQTQPGQAAPQSQPPVQTAQTSPQQTNPLQKMMQGGQKQGGGSGGGGGGGGGEKGQGGDQKKEQQQPDQSQQQSMAAPQQPQPTGGEHQGLMAALNAGQGPNYWKGMFPEATQGSPVVPRPGEQTTKGDGS